MLRETQSTRPFNGLMEAYAMTYYPGTADEAQATAITVSPGAELNMDVSMTRQTLYRIRGKVIDTRTTQTPTSIIMSLTRRGSSGAVSYEVRDSLSYNPTDGTYEVRDVLPGSYLLTATWGDSISISSSQMTALGLPPLTPQQPPDPAQRLRTNDAFALLREGVAYASVSVGNSDVENLVLSIMPGGSVSGRLRIDSPPATNAAQGPRVQLRSTLDGLPATIPAVFVPRPVPANADGTFTLPNIKAGEYRVSVEGLPNGYYVKEARMGPNDVLNRSFQFNAADNAPLEILIVAGAASINGTATNERGEPMPGALVALVPERARDRIDLYKSASANARGQFTFTDVPPGDYKVFAWEALEPNAFLNSDVLKQHDARGKIIHVQEGSAQTVDMRVIPARGGL